MISALIDGAECCLQGLEFLHSHDIIVMDIKPDNVFCNRFGTFQIGDFGLATHANSDRVSLPRADNSTWGTCTCIALAQRRAFVASPNLHSKTQILGFFQDWEEGDGDFLAPELLNADRPTLAADIYSLGATVYECATGLSPRNSLPICLPPRQMQLIDCQSDIRPHTSLTSHMSANEMHVQAAGSRGQLALTFWTSWCCLGACHSCSALSGRCCYRIPGEGLLQRTLWIRWRPQPSASLIFSLSCYSLDSWRLWGMPESLFPELLS